MRHVPFGQLGATRELVYCISAATRYGAPTFADFASGAAVAAELMLMQTSGIWDVLAWVLLPARFDAVILLRRGNLEDTTAAFLARAALRVMRVRDLACPVWDGRYTWHPIADDTRLAAAARALLRRPLRAHLTERLADYPFWDSAWVSAASRVAAAPNRPIAGPATGPAVTSTPSMAPPPARPGPGADGVPEPAPFPMVPLTPRSAVELR
jgi:putative transposase